MDATHSVRLWLNNDEGLYGLAMEAGEHADNAEDAGESIKRLLTDEFFPEVKGLYSDLLTHALASVDWDDIGEEFYSSAHENDEPEEVEEIAP